MGSLATGTLVEGVGDEVVYFISVLLIATTIALSMYFRRTNLIYTIHPASEVDVNTAREHLHTANQGEDNNRAPDTGNTQNPQQAHRNHGTQRDTVITCPVCLGDAVYAIETNCGHKFCGQCMTTYWQHGSWLGAVACPVCRTTVTLLLFHFSEEEASSTAEEKTTIMNQINLYNRRFSGQPREWMDYIHDLPTLLRHAFHEFFSVGGLIIMFRLRIIVCFVLALIYFLSPLDIIPEAVFGLLGFLDDFFILLLLAIYITIIYRRYVENRAEQAG